MIVNQVSVVRLVDSNGRPIDSLGGGASAAPLAPVALTGGVNGSNASFILATKPANGVMIFKNGLLQDSGPANDYVYDGNVTVTFDAGNIPQTGDVLLAFGY